MLHLHGACEPLLFTFKSFIHKCDSQEARVSSICSRSAPLLPVCVLFSNEVAPRGTIKTSHNVLQQQLKTAIFWERAESHAARWEEKEKTKWQDERQKEWNVLHSWAAWKIEERKNSHYSLKMTQGWHFPRHFILHISMWLCGNKWSATERALNSRGLLYDGVNETVKAVAHLRVLLLLESINRENHGLH